MALLREKVLLDGISVMRIERDAISKIEQGLGDEFVAAVELILNTEGNVIFSGVGKSGHIGRKLAATFSSTGTTSYFVHAGEAAHGDLGMIRKGDVFIGISFSGESNELMTIIPALKAMGIPIISMTGRANSSLAKAADISLVTPIEKEACPLNLAPTASTTVTMALGDAIAGALISARHFNAEDFARSHPAGALGRRLLLKVSDVMRRDEQIPAVSLDMPALDAITVLSQKRLGCFVVVDEKNRPVGIFTEGDLCRRMRSGFDFHNAVARDIMTKNPRSISDTESAFSASRLVNDSKVNQIVVTDFKGHLTGLVHIQDLVASRVA